jgi:hypothetical protein
MKSKLVAPWGRHQPFQFACPDASEMLPAIAHVLELQKVASLLPFDF